MFSGGKTPSTSNSAYWNGSVNWTTSKDMKSKYIDSTLTKMSEIAAEQTQMFQPKTLLIVVRSGILRRTLPLAILRQPSTVNQDIKTVSFYIGDVCEFVYDFLLAQEENVLTKYAKSGTTVESINFEELKDIAIPLPPLKEQQGITAAIDSAMTVIDEIESSKADLNNAVTAAKSKILSLAIRGKLVPQDPADEPASVLLERIQAERGKNIKTGKIKHGKRESAIARSDDNSYYAGLPDSWIVARICDVCEPQETKRPLGESFRYIDIEAIDNKRHSVTEPTAVRTNHAPSRAAKGVRAGDTLFSMVRPYLENIAFVTDELSDCIVSTGFYVCRPLPEIVFPNL
jgi:restriction endonuclease S subunit